MQSRAGQDRKGKKTTRTRATRYVTLLSVVLALALTAALAACGSDEPDAGTGPDRTASPPTETPASPAQTPSTPGAGDAPTATDTPVPTATTAPPAASGSAVPTVEPLATPPPLPRLSIEYDGRTYYGKQGSHCWPVSVGSGACAEHVGWMGFDRAPSVVVKQGDEVSVSVESDESSLGQVMAEVLMVESTMPVVTLGEKVYSVPAAEVVEFNLPPGVYFLRAFYQSPLGDVSYAFKLEIVE